MEREGAAVVGVVGVVQPVTVRVPCGVAGIERVETVQPLPIVGHPVTVGVAVGELSGAGDRDAEQGFGRVV